MPNECKKFCDILIVHMFNKHVLIFINYYLIIVGSCFRSYKMPRGSGGDTGLHFTKSGALDMRYSSSRAAVATGYMTSSYGTAAGASSSYNAGVASDSYGSTYSSSSASYKIPAESSSNNLHYKKDGSLDMRYSSSRQAANSSDYTSSHSSILSATAQQNSSEQLHHKKDDHLDKHYSSFTNLATSGLSGKSYSSGEKPSELHFKKDGSLDMRYKSSKVASALAADLSKMSVLSASNKHIQKSEDIPIHIKCKENGTPDMRTAEAKQWIAQQASLSKHSGRVPDWVPRNKDGKINLKTAVGRAFAVESIAKQPSREDYWKKRQNDREFELQVAAQRIESIHLPPRPSLIEAPLRVVPMSQHKSLVQNSDLKSDLEFGHKTYLIDYSALEFSRIDEKHAVLGKGSFGVVVKAKLKGIYVAVKKLHLEQLSTKEKKSFLKELSILAQLGEHKNLVKLQGYCLTPPCLIMELIRLGSLSHLLHYCDDPVIEARITDGRIKKKIIFGIANGMHQLHTSNVVHGDLKPQNVLISDGYEAKITDFGLAYFRGKTSSTIASKKLEDENDEEIIGGTAGYMAPELLDSTKPPEFSSDVYSFGVLLNELIAEEEPFSDQYANFAGRGPFGATNYARQGMRPTMSETTPKLVKQLITICWAAEPTRRPTFERIISFIEDTRFVIPNSFE